MGFPILYPGVIITFYDCDKYDFFAIVNMQVCFEDLYVIMSYVDDMN